MYHEYFENRTDVHTLYQIQDLHIYTCNMALGRTSHSIYHIQDLHDSVLLSFSKNHKQIYCCLGFGLASITR